MPIKLSGGNEQADKRKGQQMNDALLTFICVLLTMLIETLGYFAFGVLFDQTRFKQEEVNNDN